MLTTMRRLEEDRREPCHVRPLASLPGQCGMNGRPLYLSIWNSPGEGEPDQSQNRKLRKENAMAVQGKRSACHDFYEPLLSRLPNCVAFLGSWLEERTSHEIKQLLLPLAELI